MNFAMFDLISVFFFCFFFRIIIYGFRGSFNVMEKLTIPVLDDDVKSTGNFYIDHIFESNICKRFKLYSIFR